MRRKVDDARVAHDLTGERIGSGGSDIDGRGNRRIPPLNGKIVFHNFTWVSRRSRIDGDLRRSDAWGSGRLSVDPEH
ncbi:hypothetical protein [Amycolatopsis sp. NPDC051372]|uniref:hypothetical protein n=1 Tax=unclassified Amycolatopsis TaxID=2618356 RepID=UPI00342712B2